jgi:tryptophanyl-tRNA synthetase
LHEHLTAELAPIQARAAALAAEPDRVDALLADGARRARTVARETMTAVRERMGLASTADAVSTTPAQGAS